MRSLIAMLMCLPLALPAQEHNFCAPEFGPVVPQFLEMRPEDRLMPLNVPIAYLEDVHDHEVGAVHTAQLFRLDTQTYQPVTRRETSARLKQAQRRYYTFVIRNLRPLDELLQFHLEGWTSNYFDKPRPFELGPPSYQLRPVLGAYQPKEAELLVSLLDGQVDAVMNCPKKQEWHRRRPMCQAFFTAHQIDVSVTLPFDELANWPRLKAATEDFIACITRL